MSKTVVTIEALLAKLAKQETILENKLADHRQHMDLIKRGQRDLFENQEVDSRAEPSKNPKK